MRSQIAYAGDFPEPCTFCPVVRADRALAVVLGIQSLLVVLLVMLGIDPLQAMAVAIGLLCGRRLRARQVLPAAMAVLRTVLSAVPAMSTEWRTAR